jgi:uroporphyrinogen decarboxylase
MKNAVMTSKERTLSAINHQEPDRIPFTLYIEDIFYKMLEKDLGDRYNWRCPEDDIIRLLWPIDFQKTEQGCKDMFGCNWRWHDQGGYIMGEPLLSEPEVKNIPVIDLVPQSEIERIIETRKQNPDKFIFYQFTSSFGERLWSLRGLEQTYMDYILNPEFVSGALDLLLEMHMAALDKVLELPVECVTFGDDFGGQKGLMISRDIYLKFFKSRYAKLYNKVRSAGKVVGQHSCGDNTELMADYVDIGLQIFHPLQPEAMDIAKIKKDYGKHLTFRGGISTQRAIPFGTPEEAREEVRNAVKVLGEGGGYLLETAKPLRQETPIENVIAVMDEMCKAVEYDFGN